MGRGVENKNAKRPNACYVTGIWNGRSIRCRPNGWARVFTFGHRHTVTPSRHSSRREKFPFRPGFPGNRTELMAFLWDGAVVARARAVPGSSFVHMVCCHRMGKPVLCAFDFLTSFIFHPPRLLYLPSSSSGARCCAPHTSELEN